MDWYTALFEVIDMRSFSNLWYWIGLAVVWSSASHWVLGVPFDMVSRAQRDGGQAEEDLDILTRINASRLTYIVDVAGVWVLAILSFVLTGLAVLGFVYDVEFAQALFLLGFPMTLVGALSLRTARRIQAAGEAGPALRKRLIRHRIGVQAIGMVAIFTTALWGMYQNLVLGPFGG